MLTRRLIEIRRELALKHGSNVYESVCSSSCSHSSGVNPLQKNILGGTFLLWSSVKAILVNPSLETVGKNGGKVERSSGQTPSLICIDAGDLPMGYSLTLAKISWKEKSNTEKSLAEDGRKD